MSQPINKPAFVMLTEVNEGTCVIPVRHIGAIVKSKAGGSTIVCDGEKYDFTETPEQIFAMLEPNDPKVEVASIKDNLHRLAVLQMQSVEAICRKDMDAVSKIAAGMADVGKDIHAALDRISK